MGARWQRGLLVEGVPDDVKAFADGLSGVFDRIETVNEHFELTADSNCRDCRIADEQPVATDYFDQVSRNVLLRGRRLRELFNRFNIPPSVLNRVETEHSN
jgi:hypothetical protein